MELRIEAGEIRVSTLDEYLGKLNCHVLGTSEDVQRRAKKPVGYLGDVRLRDLDDTRLRRHQRELAASGVSAANRKHVFRVLHSVLQVAIELRLLDRHPMDAMSAPDAKTPEFVLPEDDQALRILGLYEGTAIEAPVLLAANGAFRLSEICGLDWQDHFEFTTWADPEDPDVTYDVALVSIERGYHDTSAGRRFEDPKSDTSERVVPIIGPAATRLKELRGIGPVCVLDGERMTSMQLYNAYRVIWQRAHRKDPSLPWVPPRNLRHLVGVQMVEGGVNVTLVSLFFGHSTDVITRQHYVRRVREKMLRGAALTLAKSRQAR
jgi:integrase